MAERIGNKIIGTWKLVSWVAVDEKGNETDFYGESPVGILTYDQAGYMNAQLMKSGRKNFTADSLYGGSLEENSRAYMSYAAYFGKYYEVSPGEFYHEVEGSLFPNWVGGTETRFAKIEGECLFLSTSPIITDDNKKIFFRVKWKRAIHQ
jgi:hypothetical protein